MRQLPFRNSCGNLATFAAIRFVFGEQLGRRCSLLGRHWTFSTDQGGGKRRSVTICSYAQCEISRWERSLSISENYHGHCGPS